MENSNKQMHNKDFTFKMCTKNQLVAQCCYKCQTFTKNVRSLIRVLMNNHDRWG